MNMLKEMNEALQYIEDSLDTEFEGIDVVDVPAGNWVILKWLPSLNYELREGPEISFDGDTGDFAKVYSEICIRGKK